MKAPTLLFALLFSVAAGAQQLPHGTTYGTKPNSAGMMDASKVEAFMGNKPRVNTTVRGKVIKVTNPKGGWFELAGTDGKVIQAHFKNIGTNLPKNLVGHYVIVEGTMAKQFDASDKQHMAGNTQKGDSSQGLSFEVTGLEVDK
jgi:hypothetical protein